MFTSVGYLNMNYILGYSNPISVLRMNEKSISISVFEDIFTVGDCTFDPILISNDREIIITYMLVCPSGRVTWMFHILIKESRKY